jgi:hypothetical protein
MRGRNIFGILTDSSVSSFLALGDSMGFGPRISSMEGIKVIATIYDAKTPKLEKKPNSIIGITVVKQKDKNAATVVIAVKKTAFPILNER